MIPLLFLFSCNAPNQATSGTAGEAAEQQSSPQTQLLTIPENGLNSGCLDRDGNLWFGSHKGGVYRYDGQFFTHFSETDGLCDNQVFSIMEDAEGNLWFGTGNGLCKYDGEAFTHLPIPFQDTSSVWLDKVYPIINPNAAYALIQDQQGNMWIGTGGGGVYRYDGEIFTPFLREIGTKQVDSLYHNWVPAIQEDAEGNIWFASMTHGGVSRYQEGAFTHYLTEDGLSDDMIRSILQDQSGKIWFGFNGNRNSGLTVYDGEMFQTLSTEDGLCNTNIQTMYEDKTGNLWLGSGRGYLCVYDGKKFTEFTTKDGQRFEGVLVILEDARGNIWFAGKGGLWKFDGETVTNLRAG